MILDQLALASVVVDPVDFERPAAMNTALTTTGLLPLTVGSTETFQLQALLSGVPWDLTGGAVTLKLVAADGTTVNLTATVSAAGVRAAWTVTGPAGTWVRAWTATDASGRKQVSRPITFAVVSSPV